MNLTRSKKKLMDFLLVYHAQHKSFPTYQAICDATGIKSRSTIHFHVEELTRLGYIKKFADGSISEVVAAPLQRASLNKLTLPLVGSIAASPPRESYEQSELLDMPDTFLGQSADLFALQVKGPSMTDAGIENGDYVFLRRQATARSGQIVAALVNGEATLKRFIKRKQGVVLAPAHPDMPEIPISPQDDFMILGVLQGYFHRTNG